MQLCKRGEFWLVQLLPYAVVVLGKVALDEIPFGGRQKEACDFVAVDLLCKGCF